MFNISELIDERKDPYFQRGEIQGFEKGFLIGRTEKMLHAIANLILETEYDDTFIAHIAGVEQQAVAQIRALIRQHPDHHREHFKDIQLDLRA